MAHRSRMKLWTKLVGGRRGTQNQVYTFVWPRYKECAMAERKIYITELDKTRLNKEIIAVAKEFSARDRADLQSLTAELERAEVVPAREMPPKVVTMNSKVVLRDVDSSETMTYTLVFPRQADIDSGRISVLAPVGTAILGYSEGDVVEWPVPSGVRHICIAEVLYQPEAAGDYHL